MTRSPLLSLVTACAAALLAGCDRGPAGPESGRIRQTQLPGIVTAGGGTSGEVVARRGASAEPAPAGTPGIPQGAGGNTSGTAMGGTVVATAPARPASSAPLALPAAERARQEQLALEAAMDRVAARWRQRAAREGWQLAAPPAEATVAEPIRSEKLGTAPPSRDAKQLVRPPTDPGVGAEAPDAVQPR